MQTISDQRNVEVKGTPLILIVVFDFVTKIVIQSVITRNSFRLGWAVTKKPGPDLKRQVCKLFQESVKPLLGFKIAE